MSQSVLYPKLTTLQRWRFDGTAEFQQICGDVVHENVNSNINELVDDLRAVEGFEDEISALMTRENYLAGVENEGWTLYEAQDGEYYFLKIAEGKADGLLHEPKYNKVDINWTAYLARHHPTRQILLNTIDHSEDEILDAAFDDRSDEPDIEKVLTYLNDPAQGPSSIEITEQLKEESMLLDYDQNCEVDDLLTCLSQQLGVTEKEILKQLFHGFLQEREFGDIKADSGDEEAAREFANDNGIDPDTNEALEHWIINDWFGGKLEERGEIVGELRNLTVWGRTTSGQSINMDGVISAIVKSDYGSRVDEAIEKMFPDLDAPSLDTPSTPMYDAVLAALEAGRAYVINVMTPKTQRRQEKTAVKLVIEDLRVLPTEPAKGWLIERIDMYMDRAHETSGASELLEPLVTTKSVSPGEAETREKLPMTQEHLDPIVEALGQAHERNLLDPEAYKPAPLLEQRLAVLSPAYAAKNNIDPVKAALEINHANAIAGKESVPGQPNTMEPK